MLEFLKNIIKVTVLGVTVWVVMRDHLPTLFAIQRGTIWTMWEVLGMAVKDLLLMAAGVFCVIAAVDYLFQKWQYTKNHMMSKDEVKREYKEMEGDPQVKGKRKQLHQEMLSQNALGNVRKAKVLVTNPTHYAVALDYEKDRTPLPVILAKGEGFLAQRMIRVAQEEGIPIMRNVPLARSLFENGTFLLVEYGIESTDNRTLQRINRGHTFECTADAVKRTAERGIRVGGHVILGLPGEDHEAIIRQAAQVSELPLTTLKMHQLQLVRGTRMAREYGVSRGLPFV